MLLYAVLFWATGNKQDDRKSKIGRNDGRRKKGEALTLIQQTLL